MCLKRLSSNELQFSIDFCGCKGCVVSPTPGPSQTRTLLHAAFVPEESSTSQNLCHDGQKIINAQPIEFVVRRSIIMV